MPVKPVRLNHAVLFVADLERSVRFYTEVFGMVVVTRQPRANAAFLRLPRSGNHHDLGLFGVGPQAPPKRRGGIGLYHLAWQVDTIDELAQARQPSSAPTRTPASRATAPRRASTHRPRRQRVRGDVDASPCRPGRLREPGPDRQARPTGRARPPVRRPHRRGHHHGRPVASTRGARRSALPGARALIDDRVRRSRHQSCRGVRNIKACLGW
jgi:catechol 2,3-dioxygenase-like lactoylglutathione lyase family enzyme